MSTTYSTEFKVKTIRRYEKGESIKSLSEELHISQSTIYQWRKVYCSLKTPNRTYTPKEFDAISRRLQKLEHQLEIIRLSGYLSSVPLQKKLATLEHLYNQPDNPYSVHEPCDALGVARRTFYNHIFRRADRSKHEDEQAQLTLIIKQALDDSSMERRKFGPSLLIVVSMSAKSGSPPSCRNWDYAAYGWNAKKQFKRKQQYAKQNLLKREFSADHPNQM